MHDEELADKLCDIFSIVENNRIQIETYNIVVNFVFITISEKTKYYQKGIQVTTINKIKRKLKEIDIRLEYLSIDRKYNKIQICIKL